MQGPIVQFLIAGTTIQSKTQGNAHLGYQWYPKKVQLGPFYIREIFTHKIFMTVFYCE